MSIVIEESEEKEPCIRCGGKMEFSHENDDAYIFQCYDCGMYKQNRKVKDD